MRPGEVKGALNDRARGQEVVDNKIKTTLRTGLGILFLAVLSFSGMVCGWVWLYHILK